MDALTLVMPLQMKKGLSREDFYEYWLNAHVTLPARFPGIENIWLHATSFDLARWPRIDGVSHRPPPEDDFEGVPEATFPTFPALEAFVGAARVQMEDGINFLGQQITYRAFEGNSRTVVDETGIPAPDGHDELLRHLVFLRARPGVSAAALRDFVGERIVPAFAKSSEVLKLRVHYFEPVEGTLDHPGVLLFKPLERQYQVALEVIVADETAMARFVASPAWTASAPLLAQHCEAVHAARVTRCITTKYEGRMTLAGVRGVAVADVIRRLDAKSQHHRDVSILFVNQLEPALHGH